ncbi:UNVERIFIED_CONTAM: hypothetical protein FKN15_066813 [Acipenser sinensis]
MAHSISISFNQFPKQKFFYDSSPSQQNKEKDQITVEEDVLPFDHVKGYVTVRYDSHWWLNLVVSADQKKWEAEINFLHPNGPARSLFPTLSRSIYCRHGGCADISGANNCNRRDMKMAKASKALTEWL